MKKNDIDSLNEQLFDQLTRLNSDIKGDDLKLEIERGKSMANISSEILKGAKLKLDAAVLLSSGKVHSENLDIFKTKQLGNG